MPDGLYRQREPGPSNTSTHSTLMHLAQRRAHALDQEPKPMSSLSRATHKKTKKSPAREKKR